MNPLWQLVITRFREFYREPAAIFWVYGFPLLLAIALGVAFRDRPVEKLNIIVMSQDGDPQRVKPWQARLAQDDRLRLLDAQEDWKLQLRNGKADLVVIVHKDESKTYLEYWSEKKRPESVLARATVENVLLHQQNSANEQYEDHQLDETGSRYIDFLIPGLIGMNLMGGGLFGVGFVIVDMRVRKLLKRYLATPMRRSHFLLSIMISRLLFIIPEVILLFSFGWLVFGVAIQGNLFNLLVFVLMGASCFAGIGLLIACRARTIETVSGLMNLLMLPMYVLSGVFFSSERFPDAMQPFIALLPLTALIHALRGIVLESQSLIQLWRELAILLGWGIISFAVALKFFRWK